MRNKYYGYLAFASRIILGLIFLVSGSAKLADITGFKWQLASLKLFYWIISNSLSIAIPIVEIIIGVFLLLGIFTRFSCIHLGVFLLVLIWVSYYASNILNLENCKCFGELVEMEFGPGHIMLLVLLLVLDLVILFDKNRIWSVRINKK